jgi:hypothetical protein
LCGTVAGNRLTDVPWAAAHGVSTIAMYSRPGSRISRAAAKAAAYSIDDPPQDWPEDLKVIYKLASAPRLTLSNICYDIEVGSFRHDSLVEWSNWADMLNREWRDLRNWIKNNEACYEVAYHRH